ncbi:MAG: M23 family metallopeptidase [Cyanobacteriota bacterium]|nr:M23 family metallopeptidase [Cyanobacteriota bacterium]
MNFRPRQSILFRFLWLNCAIALTLTNPIGSAAAQNNSPEENSICPPPALSRLTRHTIVPGETLLSIAAQYDLIEATLIGMNPILRRGSAPVGTEIFIPPYNGIPVEVPLGSTWSDLAEAYTVRADALFEVNGCQPPEGVVFVPGVNWSPSEALGRGGTLKPATGALAAYPLPSDAEVVVDYGWVLTAGSPDVIFHSGLDLLAPEGTSVVSVEAGTVAFAGEQGIYGNLVVINHQQGKQTRYAHLESITVRVGEEVSAETPIGTVGTTGVPDTEEPHLHFEVRSNTDLGWVAEDPKEYLRSPR